ncbi:MAG TPA: outer membrane protein assembly factor BamD [Terriglobales bacterium]|nr:outer membrane protein assembly factor BamD [Terriglobales bacterium]
MYRRLLVTVAAAVIAFSLAGCTNKKVQNPIADLGSKQPDKVLFDRAMDALKHNKFDVARMTLQTLINTYPDSEFVARAKLAIGDSWYAEGGSAALQQAEAEYKDFETFFPNMPEAAEAQFKVATIHYNQMEKPDRDFTHAKRAEDELRNMIQQYPDSPLLPKAKERLREVQEVLAEREFRIGRFYYLRESWPAAIARLTSLTDAYPLYSGADEALFMLGDSYEKQILQIRTTRLAEASKAKLIKEFQEKAANAYQRIVTRYPVMPRVEDAKARLQALKLPVPVPTPEAIAQNKAEQESRSTTGMWGRTMLTFRKRPDIAQASKVGEPTLVDPKPTNAPEIVRHASDVLSGKNAEGNQQVSIEQVGTGAPPTSDAVPRSDTQVDPNAAPQQDNGIPSLTPIGEQPAAQPAAGQGTAAPATQTPMTTNPGMQPTAAPAQPASTVQQSAPAQPALAQTGSQEAVPNAAPPQVPSQVNDAKGSEGDEASASSDSKKQDDSKNVSSSKKKKKKGLGKLNPF